jgi:hypothetical protein
VKQFNLGNANMKRAHVTLAILLCGMVSAVGLSGCEQKAPSAVRPASPRVSANPSPEEKFDFIVETFRRGVEDTNIFFRVPSEGGHSMLAGQNEVKHEIIKPTKEGEPYRGIITVVSESHYSIERSSDRGEEKTRQEQARNQDSQSALGDLNSSDGIDILDSDLAGESSAGGSSSRSGQAASDSTVARRRDQSDRKYELEYHEGRWVLLTKLDPETEQGIQFAFDHALKTQI